MTPHPAMESEIRLDRPSCVLCGRRAEPWMIAWSDPSRPDDASSYQLYWCEPCRYGFVWPRPDPSLVPDFYRIDKYYTHSAAQGEAPPASATGLLDRFRIHIAWRADRGIEMRSSIENLAKGGRRRICDIGCGNGGLLTELRRVGHEVTGVEVDPVARRVATSQGLRVLEGTAEELPATLATESCDVVVMSHSLEHTLDPIKAIRNVSRLVAPEGALVIEVPNNQCQGLASRGVAWRWLDVPRHLNFFTQRSLCRIVERVGFCTQAIEWTGYCRMFHGDWIAEEQARWQHYSRNLTGIPPRGSTREAWRLLLRTAVASPRLKYDSVRVIGRRA